MHNLDSGYHRAARNRQRMQDQIAYLAEAIITNNQEDETLCRGEILRLRRLIADDGYEVRLNAKGRLSIYRQKQAATA